MIGLISCSKRKLDYRAPARELYGSSLFQLSLKYAEVCCDHVFVISALHGLVELDRVIRPYDRSLGGVASRRRWATRTVEQIGNLTLVDDRIMFLAGAEYVDALKHEMHQRQWTPTFIEPLRGLGTGKRLSLLSKATRRIP